MEKFKDKAMSYFLNKALNPLGKVSARNVKIFKDTPVYKVAKTLASDDYDKVLYQLKGLSGNLIDCQEPFYGQTLLSFSTLNGYYNACRALVDAGADVNITSSYDGDSAFTTACKIKEDNRFILLYLENGANVHYELADSIRGLRTPLIMACDTGLDKVKLLIDAGADPNYYKENGTSPRSPLNHALSRNKIDIVNYLVMEQKVDVKKIYKFDHGITWALRQMLFPLDSKRYQMKMELVNYLKKEGVDYSAEPIPERILEIKEGLEKKYGKGYLDIY
ncbi:ankyrin repeat domain-containing protein [Flammeovirga sp. OC4]|uniref:ankyrin repeat domain-containing protein n=1 Tax=Flammeovirga sp. OC4 TaxID=1382345 RepID=UPI00155DC917|nr:ankyrin repeat domain-containing protein [Flammeovirga sp. OC4]